MRSLLLLFLVFFFKTVFCQDSLIAFYEPFSFMKPDTNFYEIRKAGFNERKDLFYIIFGHHGIRTDSGEIVTPTISLVVNSFSDTTDLMSYVMMSQRETNFKVISIKTSTEFGCVEKNGLVYHAKYKRDDDPNVYDEVYVAYFVRGKEGFQIITDATESTFPLVKSEMEGFIQQFSFLEL